MKKTMLSAVCAALLGLGLAASVPTAQAQLMSSAHAVVKAEQPTAPELHKAMRALWHGHVVTTRNYALAVHAGDKAAAAAAADTVVDNAKQITAAVAGFYGQPAADGLLTLLAGHWGAVKALTDNAQAGNQAGVDQAMTDMGLNAGEIAKFLASANPNWKEADLQAGLIAHGGHHKSQIDLMMSNAPKADQNKEWLAMQDHMDAVADVLADGIAKQFPDKAK